MEIDKTLLTLLINTLRDKEIEKAKEIIKVIYNKLDLQNEGTQLELNLGANNEEDTNESW